jgi:hypothetical protein
MNEIITYLIVVLAGYQGVVDLSGDIIIPFKCEKVCPPTDQRFVVCQKDMNNPEISLWGALDMAGREAVPMQYQSLTPFSKGKAIAEKGRKFSIVDIQGNLLEDLPYTEIQALDRYGRRKVKKGDKFGLLDIEHNLIVPPIHDTIYRIEGAYIVSDIDATSSLVIDFKGNPLATVSNTWHIHNYLDEFMIGSNVENAFGIVDKVGNVVVPPIYDTLSFHYNPFQVIRDSSNNIHLADFFVIGQNLESGRSDLLKITHEKRVDLITTADTLGFGNGTNKFLFRAREGGVVQYGIINELGVHLCTAQYDHIGLLRTPDGEVRSDAFFYKSGANYGLLSQEGEILVRAEYHGIWYLGPSLYLLDCLLFNAHKKETILDDPDICIIKPLPRDNLIFIARDNSGKYGLYHSSQHKWILDPLYDQVVTVACSDFQ